MSTTIHVLPDALVNQIAAGEVVERPASVVKELIENALDAGASTLRVEVDEGGIVRIVVSDDGHGMTRDDAELAVKRHATSKIAAPEDLIAIHTFGFRGEALPSIASVSKFRLVTRTKHDVGGTALRIDGGEAAIIEPIGCAVGTTIDVSDLFFNVPARRKFLRATSTENAQISEVCFRAALSKPELRLTLFRNGKRAREYVPARDRAERAKTCFDEALRELTFEDGTLRGQAFLGAPERARSGANGLHVLVNGRAVRDRRIAAAVAQAYGSVLPTGRYPSGVLYLEIDPSEVDVNVHPQKAEVRLAGGARALDRLTRALARALGTTAWRGPASTPQIAVRPGSSWEERLGSALREEATPYASSPDAPFDSGASDQAVTEHRERAGEFSSLRAIAQVRKMLIVCEGADGLSVIDQHAADERVKFDRLRKTYRERAIATQRLLFPERVEVSPTEAARVREMEAEIAALGLECTLVGEQTVAVHTVPALVRRAPAERLLRDVLDELAFEGGRAFGDAVDMALATMACHGSIRAGDELSLAECQALLRSMDGVEDFKAHCPHGRPVVYTIAWGELERRVGR